jgi:dihydrofolate reductase
VARVIVMENVSLDGVMQAPGRADEDTRDGFERGGWFQPYNDEVLGRYLGNVMGEAGPHGGLVLGRRTYEDFFGYWPKLGDDPFTKAFEATTKYVASTTLTEPLPWQNSVLLRDPVTELPEIDADLTVLGSGVLAAALASAGLVDEYLLLVAPLLLGKGRRLFTGQEGPLRLTECVPTSTGVLISRYVPA